MKIKVGFGFDVHQLEENRKFIIGGIEIKHNKGIVAHSDGDVLIHAVCDALLGAANMRDIGFHFPDTDKEFKGIDSKILLSRTCKLLSAQGFAIGNIDCTVCLESPKINQYIPLMQQTIAKLIGVETTDISIKATTTEKMGYIGREDGVSVYAVALIEKV